MWLALSAILLTTLLIVVADVVHIHHLNHLSSRLPAIAKKFGAAVVFTLHGACSAATSPHHDTRTNASATLTEAECTRRPAESSADFHLMCSRGTFLQYGVGSCHELCSGYEGGAKCAEKCLNRFGTGAALAATTPHRKRPKAPPRPVLRPTTSFAARSAGATVGHPDDMEADLEANTRWAEKRNEAMQEAASAVDYFIAPSIFLRDRFVNEWARCPASADRMQRCSRCWRGSYWWRRSQL